jgi:hypothetical protein
MKENIFSARDFLFLGAAQKARFWRNTEFMAGLLFLNEGSRGVAGARRKR